jgi:hypothetical protein
MLSPMQRYVFIAIAFGLSLSLVSASVRAQPAPTQNPPADGEPGMQETPAPADRSASADAPPPRGPRSSPPPPLPPPRRLPRPFRQGQLDFGGALGIGSTGQGIAFTVGLNVGYFVLNGLEPGIYADVTFGSGVDTQMSVLPFVRWMLYRSRRLSPYLKVQGGGLWFVNGPSTPLIGGGGGIVVGLRGRLGLNLEFIALRLTNCSFVDECWRYNGGVSLSVFY